MIAVAAAPRIAPTAPRRLRAAGRGDAGPGQPGLDAALGRGRSASSRRWLSKDCAFAWSPKVLRAGQGAHFQLAIHEDADLVAIGRRAHASDGVRVLATVASGGTPIDRASLAPRVALAVGNEGAGLSDALREAADEARDDPDAGRHRIAERRGRDRGRALRDRAPARYCCGTRAERPGLDAAVAERRDPRELDAAVDVRRMSEIATVVSKSPQV